jgi:hypothetical protein
MSRAADAVGEQQRVGEERVPRSGRDAIFKDSLDETLRAAAP